MRYTIVIRTKDDVIEKYCNSYHEYNGLIYLYKHNVPEEDIHRWFFCYKLKDGDSVIIRDKEED